MEPLELRSPNILDRGFFTRTPSSTIILFWVLIKSSVSFAKKSVLIFAAIIESRFVESCGIFGFFQVKIWAFTICNAKKIGKRKSIFLVKIFVG